MMGSHEDSFIEHRIDVPKETLSKVRCQYVPCGSKELPSGSNSLAWTGRHERHNIRCDTVLIRLDVVSECPQQVCQERQSLHLCRHQLPRSREVHPFELVVDWLLRSNGLQGRGAQRQCFHHDVDQTRNVRLERLWIELKQKHNREWTLCKDPEGIACLKGKPGRMSR